MYSFYLIPCILFICVFICTHVSLYLYIYACMNLCIMYKMHLRTEEEHIETNLISQESCHRWLLCSPKLTLCILSVFPNTKPGTPIPTVGLYWDCHENMILLSLHICHWQVTYNFTSVMLSKKTEMRWEMRSLEPTLQFGMYTHMRAHTHSSSDHITLCSNNTGGIYFGSQISQPLILLLHPSFHGVPSHLPVLNNCYSERLSMTT